MNMNEHNNNIPSNNFIATDKVHDENLESYTEEEWQKELEEHNKYFEDRGLKDDELPDNFWNE